MWGRGSRRDVGGGGGCVWGWWWKWVIVLLSLQVFSCLVFPSHNYLHGTEDIYRAEIISTTIIIIIINLLLLLRIIIIIIIILKNQLINVMSILQSHPRMNVYTVINQHTFNLLSCLKPHTCHTNKPSLNTEQNTASLTQNKN